MRTNTSASAAGTGAGCGQARHSLPPAACSLRRLQRRLVAQVELSAAELAELQAVVPEGAVVGDRYAGMQHSTYHCSGAAAGQH